jgi:hypothetical protein
VICAPRRGLPQAWAGRGRGHARGVGYETQAKATAERGRMGGPGELSGAGRRGAEAGGAERRAPGGSGGAPLEGLSYPVRRPDRDGPEAAADPDRADLEVLVWELLARAYGKHDTRKRVVHVVLRLRLDRLVHQRRRGALALQTVHFLDRPRSPACAPRLAREFSAASRWSFWCRSPSLLCKLPWRRPLSFVS